MASDEPSNLVKQAWAALEGVTLGPWFTPDAKRLQGAISAMIDGRDCQVASIDGQAPMFDVRGGSPDEIARANARFIAWARTGVEQLADALEQAERVIERHVHGEQIESDFICLAGLKADEEKWALAARVEQLEAAARELIEARDGIDHRGYGEGRGIRLTNALAELRRLVPAGGKGE